LFDNLFAYDVGVIEQAVLQYRTVDQYGGDYEADRGKVEPGVRVERRDGQYVGDAHGDGCCDDGDHDCWVAA